MVKPSKAFVPQAEDSPRKIFQVGSLFASLLSKRETDRILKFGFLYTKGKITKKKRAKRVKGVKYDVYFTILPRNFK